MKSLLLFIAFSFLLTSSGYAQLHWEFTTPPKIGNVRVFSRTSPGAIFLVDHDILALSTDLGETWQTEPLAESIKHVSIFDDNWLIGWNDETIYRSSDFGNTWHDIYNVHQGYNHHIYDVLVYGYRDVYIFDRWQDPMNREWFVEVGYSMTKGTKPIHLKSLWVSPNIGINRWGRCFISEHYTFFYTDGGGEELKEYSKRPHVPTGKIAFVNGTYPMFYGSTDASGLIYTLDDGKSWLELPNIHPPYPPHLYNGDNGQYIYGCHEYGNMWEVWRYHLLDEKWQYLTSFPYKIHAMEFEPDGSILLALNSMGVYRFHPENNSYENIYKGKEWSKVNSVYRASAEVLLATDQSKCIYRSTDNGLSWDRALTYVPERDVRFLAMPDGSVLLNGSSVLRSTDAGVTWEENLIGYNPGILSLSATQHVYTVTDSGAFRSSDLGINWNMVNVPDSLVSSRHHLIEAPSGMLLLGSDSSGIFYSASNGLSWQQARPDSIQAVKLIADKSDIYALSPHQGLWKANQDGTHWDLVYEADEDTLTDALISPEDLLLVATRNNGLQYSTNGGSTWDESLIGLTKKTVLSLSLTSDGYLYAGTEKAGLFRTTTSVLATDSHSASLFSLSQNHPNPVTHSETSVSYSLESPAEVELSLYNTLGVKIRTLSSGYKAAGKHTVRVDVSGLAPGVYYYTMQTPGQTRARRLVIVDK